MCSRVILRRNFCSSFTQRQRITVDEFRSRRYKLFEGCSRAVSDTNSQDSLIVFLNSRRKTFSSPSVPHVFRQCSNFRYLTGFDATDTSQLVIRQGESVFFNDPRSDNDILWNGETLSADEIISLSGVDLVLPFSEFQNYMAAAVRSDSVLAADMETIKLDAKFDEKVKNSYQLLRAIPKKISIGNLLDHLRWYKSRAEIEIMRETCKIGSSAINATIGRAKSFTNESHIVGSLEFEVRRRGAQYLAYPPVVASGSRANIIHYITSNKDMDPKNCVLVDAGCDVEGYISDITRCFPLSGKFSDPQRTLYEALHHIHIELLDYVEYIRPLKLNELYSEMLRLMATTLDEIAFFKRSMSWEERVAECDNLCPHHVSHYLGMDIHDSPNVMKDISIPPNVVLTVEPAVYVRPGNNNIHEQFHGIGFRIEDDVLITNTGHEVLTNDCIKDPDDIESLISHDF